MNREHDAFIHVIETWLDLEVDREDPELVLDRVVGRLEAMPQRRALWPARRFAFMNNRFASYGAAAVILVAAALFGASLLPRDVSGLGPASSAPQPTASRAPSSSPIPLERGEEQQALEGGRYRAAVGVGGRHFRFDLTIPDGWIAHRVTIGDLSLTGPDKAYPYLGFFSVQRVYRDPCHPEARFAGNYLALGLAGDVIGELQSLPGFETAQMDDVVVGGLDARYFILSNSIDTETARCTDGAMLPLFATWDADKGDEIEERSVRSPATNGGTTLEVWVVERGRHRYPMLIVAEADPNGDQEADRAAIQAIIGSLDFL